MGMTCHPLCCITQSFYIYLSAKFYLHGLSRLLADHLCLELYHCTGKTLSMVNFYAATSTLSIYICACSNVSSLFISLSFATIMLLTKCTFHMNAYNFHRALIFIYFNGYTFILALLIDGAL